MDTRNRYLTKVRHPMSQQTAWKVNALKEADRHGEYERYEVRENGFGPLICDVFRVGEKGKKYANLIAATPELLDALKELREIVKTFILPAAQRCKDPLWTADAFACEAVFEKVDKAIRRAEEGGD